MEARRGKHQNIMDSLAGIDNQLNELSKKGDEADPLLLFYSKASDAK